MGYQLDKGEVGIILRPDEFEGKPTGNISVGLVFGEEGDLSVTHLVIDEALNMAASAMFINDNPDLLEEVEDYKHEMLEAMFPEQYAEAQRIVDEQDKVIRKGNVYTLNKWSKTDGTA